MPVCEWAFCKYRLREGLCHLCMLALPVWATGFSPPWAGCPGSWKGSGVWEGTAASAGLLSGAGGRGVGVGEPMGSDLGGGGRLAALGFGQGWPVRMAPREIR